ncbi:glycosyltransferase family 39 protein [Candidatus Obscuribacterales bacterium]|nr:glycosyltransferase family 39 protein [Candidatus Obscuribacterales bacterium]MBX3151569.1 glycosyltransferase family 39 protein [Candidatus Obscuribacterales bacterium]
METSSANATQVNRPDSKKKAFDGITAVIVVFIIAIGLRFNGLTFDSMWLDEAYQTMVDAIGVAPNELEILRPEPFIYSLGAPGSPQQLLTNFRNVDPLCPPLYFLLLNRWMTVFGTDDFAVRSLSALISVASLAVLYFGTRKLLGPKVAFFTLVIHAFSPFDITYAQEARMYGLVTLTSAASGLSLFFLIDALGNNATIARRIGLTLLYSISTAALINTHYTGLYVVLFQGLFGTAYSISKRNFGMLFQLGIAWALVCLFWLPWFDLFRQSAGKRGNFYVTRDSGIFWSLKGAFKIVLNWINFMGGGRIVAYAAPLYGTSAVLLATAAFISFPSKIRNAIVAKLTARKGSKTEQLEPETVSNTAVETDGIQSKDRSNAMFFVWCWALVPALIALASDIAESRKTIEVTRYLMGTAPAVFILAGCGARYLVENGGKLKWFVVAHVLFTLVNYTYAHTVPQREPWKQMAVKIEEKVPPTDVLFISPHYNLICIDRYLKTPRMQVGTGPLLGNQQVYAILKGRYSFWLLTAQQGSTVTAFIPPEFQLVESLKMSHGLELTHYQAPKPAADQK